MALRGVKEATTNLIFKYLPDYPPEDEQGEAPSARVQAAFNAALSELDEDEDLGYTQHSAASRSPVLTAANRLPTSSQNSSAHTSPLSQRSNISPVRATSSLPEDIFERTAREVREAYGGAAPRQNLNTQRSPPASTQQRYASPTAPSTPTSIPSPTRTAHSSTSSPLNGWSPGSSQPSPTRAAGAVPGRALDNAHSIDDSQLIARKERTGRQYVPKQETGNWAILVALFLYAHEGNSMTDEVLKGHAERHARAAMFQTGDQMYTAFSGVKKLVECGYCYHFARPSRYALTASGRDLAEQLWGEYSGTIPRNGDPGDDDDDAIPEAHSPIVARIAHPLDRNNPTPIASPTRSPTTLSPSTSPPRGRGPLERIPLSASDFNLDLYQQHHEPHHIRSHPTTPSQPNAAPPPRAINLPSTIPSAGLTTVADLVTPARRGRGRPKKNAAAAPIADEVHAVASQPAPIARANTATLPTSQAAPRTPTKSKASTSAPVISPSKPRSPQAAAAAAAINRATNTSLIPIPLPPLPTPPSSAPAPTTPKRAPLPPIATADLASAAPPRSPAAKAASAALPSAPATQVFPHVIDLDDPMPDYTATPSSSTQTAARKLPSLVASAVVPNEDLSFGPAVSSRRRKSRMDIILSNDLEEDILIPPSAKRPKPGEPVDSLNSSLAQSDGEEEQEEAHPVRGRPKKKQAAPEPELRGWRTERYTPPDPDTLTHIIRDPEVDRPLQSSKPGVAIPPRISDLPLLPISREYMDIPNITEHTITKIIVCVDERERRRFDLTFDYIQSALVDLGFEVRTVTLSICDYIWLGVDANEQHFVMDYAVERKRMGDLALSLLDNRYFEQKWRMRHTGISNLFYFIEEPLDVRTKGFEVETPDMFAAIAATAYGDDFRVFRVRDAMDTIRSLAEISTHIQTQYLETKISAVADTDFLELIKVTHHATTNFEKFERCLTDHSHIHWTFDQFQERFRKTRQLEGSDLFAYQLMSLLDMGPRKAAAIVLKYKSLPALIEAYKQAGTREERISMIALLEAGGTKVGVDMAVFLLDTVAPTLEN